MEQLNPEQLQAEIGALRAMLNSGGWALYSNMLRQTIRVAKARMRAESNPTELAKHTGVMLACDDLLSWPERQIELLLPLAK